MGREVKCFFCFEYFKPEEAHFRAKKHIKKIDSLSEDEYVVDEKLKAYYKKFLQYDDDSAESAARLLPTFKIDQNRKIVEVSYNSLGIEGSCLEKEADHGMPIKIKFDRRLYESNVDCYETDERLCPHCHNRLPVGFGLRKSIIISVIGDTYSGKTVFLTVLLKELASGNNKFETSLSYIGKDLSPKETLYAARRKLYEERKLPESTQTGTMLPPFLFNCKYKRFNERKQLIEEDIDIAIYDIAGENCRDEGKMEALAPNVKNSDGIIFLLNPMALSDVSDYYRHIGTHSGETSTYSQEMVLEAIHNAITGSSIEKCEIPLALVVSKTDNLWKEEVNLDFFTRNPQSPMLKRNFQFEKHAGYFDKIEELNISNSVKDFLNSTDAKSFVNFIGSNFKNQSYFAVSALGNEPNIYIDESERVIGIIEKSIRPFRILEPLYWILCKNGLILESDFTPKKQKRFLFF